MNLTAIASSEWGDSIGAYPIPTTLTNLALKVSVSSLRSGAKLWYATPDNDHGKAHELTYSIGSDTQGTFLTCTLPRLAYWDMVWLEQ
jgi:dextranase